MNGEHLTSESPLGELREILQLATLEVSPQRSAATRYTQCRELLLRSALKPRLPGFVLQCATIYRFQEFIHHYHPHIQARTAFLNRAFQADSVMPQARSQLAVFGDF